MAIGRLATRQSGADSLPMDQSSGGNSACPHYALLEAGGRSTKIQQHNVQIYALIWAQFVSGYSVFLLSRSS